MSRCKICESNYKEDIDKFLLDGCNLDFLVSWSKSRQIDITKKQFETHAKKHLESWKPIDFKSVKVEVLEDNKLVNNVINFEQYCKDMGIVPKDFQDLENNIDKVVYNSQKIVATLFYKSSCILDAKLDSYMKDRTTYPKEEVRGFRAIYEVYSAILGINQQVNLNTAIQTIEKFGYKVIDESSQKDT